MDWACDWDGREIEFMQDCVVWEPVGKRPLRRPRRKWKEILS
jgi:hypothetical protein